MDVYAEQLLAKQKTNKEKIIQIILLLLGCLIIGFTAFFGVVIHLFILFLVIPEGYGLLSLMRQFEVEYEYTLTNGQFDVDMIQGKSRRKRLVSFDCKTVCEVGKRSEMPSGVAHLIVADVDNPNLLYMKFTETGAGARAIVFAPDEKMKTALNQCIPRTISAKYFD